MLTVVWVDVVDLGWGLSCSLSFAVALSYEPCCLFNIRGGKAGFRAWTLMRVCRAAVARLCFVSV